MSDKNELKIWDGGKTAALKQEAERLSDEELLSALDEAAARDVERVRRSAILRVRAYERGVIHPKLSLRPPLWAFLIYQEQVLPELVVKCDGNDAALRLLRFMDQSLQAGIASGEVPLKLAVETDGQVTHRILSLPDATGEELAAVLDDEARRFRPLGEQLAFIAERQRRRAKARRRLPDALEDVDAEELTERKTIWLTEAEARAALLLHHEEGIPLGVAHRRVVGRV